MLRPNDEELSRTIVDDNDDSIYEQQQDNELDPENTGICFALCNPRAKVHRFIALIFMCLLGFGSYFCFDNPGALQDEMKKDLNMTTADFTMLYSIYSWPNVILCFVGGFLIDRVFGIRLGTVIYLFILLIGQFIFAFGAFLDTYWVLIVGRFIFGIGAESLAVAQNNYAVLWFKGKELNMVFGLQLSFARVGSTVNFVVMEPIYNYVQKFYQGHTGIGVVLILAGTTCVMSFICALVLGFMDKRAQRILRRVDNSNGEIAKLSDVFTFKLTFWMVSVICVAYYVAIFPFIALGKVFFEQKWNFTPQQANNVTSCVYIISALASPIFGFVIDKTARNVSWIFFAITSTIVAHSILAFTYTDPYVGMVIMGLSYALLASSLWPLVAIIIPEYQLGSAYGICQSVQNLGLAVVSIVSGKIVDKYGFLRLEIFFISWLSIALLATIVIWIYDFKTKGNLNMSPNARKIYSDNLLAEASNNFLGSNSIDNLNPEEISATTHAIARRRRSGNENSSDQEPLLIRTDN